MTCREKLFIDHPDDVDSTWCGGCRGCPHHHGYLPKPAKCEGGRFNSEHICTACWDREIPGTNSNDGITTTNEKEKNMATTKKTKAELMEELEKIKNDKAELEKELKNLENYKQYEECADETKAMHTAFMNSGFSDEQAFELVKMMMQSALSQQFTKAVLRR